MNQKSVLYTRIDKEQLGQDIDAIKAKIGKPTQKDFQHLLKIERWGHVATFLGYGLIAILSLAELFLGLTGFIFYLLMLISTLLISTGNVSRWANVTHPILHGAYDKVPNIPKRYTRKYFAKGSRRYLDWLDWIKPEAWVYEHNIMHHYHLGEKDDPDCVYRSLTWNTQSKILRYLSIYSFMGLWKPLYYAPNTLKVLEEKKFKKKNHAFKLWVDCILPYIGIKFILIPLLFIPFGLTAVLNAVIVVLIAEYFANLHSYLLIAPNHMAEDIYMFEEPCQSQGEFYLRQIMGSVNYNTGGDLRDFCHGWLNYQIEHHLFPNLSLSQYQEIQPLVKKICYKHNIPYRQESVFRRIKMTIEILVGNKKMLTIPKV